MRLRHLFAAGAMLMRAECSLAGPAPVPAQQAAGPLTVPTQFSPVLRSLQQLIGDGYVVTNFAVGLTGFGYLLKQGSHYVTCAVQPDHARAGMFVSECRAMN